MLQITPLLTSSATENYFENFVLRTPLHSCKQTLALQGTFGFTERIFKDSPHLTLLPLKSSGVLPISVAGNLNLWQALLKSTIHLNISNNLTNIQLQRCEALQPSTPIIPEAGKSERELTVQGHCNLVTDLQTAPKGRQHPTLTIIPNTEFFMSRFLAPHPITCFVTIFNAYFIKSLCILQYTAAPVAKTELDQSSNSTQPVGQPVGTGKLYFQMLPEKEKSLKCINNLLHGKWTNTHLILCSCKQHNTKKKKKGGIYLYFNKRP